MRKSLRSEHRDSHFQHGETRTVYAMNRFRLRRYRVRKKFRGPKEAFFKFLRFFVDPRTFSIFSHLVDLPHLRTYSENTRTRRAFLTGNKRTTP